MSSNIPIICLMGPTASGKTALAIELTQQLPCEIISVDSALIYRGLDIGTAKPSKEELQRAPHRLIDICDPNESYSVGQFCIDVAREIEEIITKGKFPLLVGGTMMYFHALQFGLDEVPSRDLIIRQQILQQAEEIGWEKLHVKLEKIDPVAAKKIHPHDSQRISRALEVFKSTRIPFSTFHRNKQETAEKKYLNIILEPTDRAALHARIEQRFDEMLAKEFLAEVAALRERGDLHSGLPAMRIVGYRQAWSYFSGQCDYASMRETAIAATRQLAKRQLTWLRRWTDAYRIDPLQQNFLENNIVFMKKLIQTF